ncbi:MAG: DUF6602 domain-containing protein [Acidimicrobiales bacterium]
MTGASDLLLRRLDEWEARLREAHAEFVELARSDAQKAGHKAEGIWSEVALELLPPTFRVLTRKYIGPEVDLVVLPPSAPRFYDGAKVTDIPPDIACAIVHVKNTLDRGELRDAMTRISAMNEGPPRYMFSRDKERERLPAAVVALGSDWANEFISARKAFGELLEEQGPKHPSQIPGFIGTPDWDLLNHCVEIPALTSDVAKLIGTSGEPTVDKLLAEKPTGRPIHAFAQWLYGACTVHEPSLEATRVALVQMFGLQGEATRWSFQPESVYSVERAP